MTNLESGQNKEVQQIYIICTLHILYNKVCISQESGNSIPKIQFIHICFVHTSSIFLSYLCQL